MPSSIIWVVAALSSKSRALSASKLKPLLSVSPE